MKKLAIIDADSIVYIIAWQYRLNEERDVYPEDEIVQGAVDQFMIGILQATQATHYITAIGCSTGKCFRYDIAKYSPYKKGRREKDPWVKKWEPIIRYRLVTDWAAQMQEELEADDIVALAYWASKDFYETVICSPDKDLRQLPGMHFDYRKTDFAEISEEDANRNLWYQMLVGDSTDGVSGLPGVGPKKATEKLDAAKASQMFYEQIVRSEYFKYFGDYYGTLIFNENFAVLSLMSPRHLFYAVCGINEFDIRSVPDQEAGGSVFGE